MNDTLSTMYWRYLSDLQYHYQCIDIMLWLLLQEEKFEPVQGPTMQAGVRSRGGQTNDDDGVLGTFRLGR